MMRLLLLVALLSAGACSRQVTVQTAPAAAADVSLRVTNTASQAVTVFVTASGTELQAGQVPANSTATIPLRGVPSGSTVRLRAALADGSRSYTRDGVVVTSVFEWRVP